MIQNPASLLRLAAFASLFPLLQQGLIARTAPPKKTEASSTAVTQVSKPLTGWPEVERLISEQKLQEAFPHLEKLLAEAKAAKDEKLWTKALMQMTRLRMGLHGYETAVKFLRDQSWPQALLYRSSLRLVYAQALTQYLQMYGWEIGQREKVETKGELDLKAWTQDQILAEAVRAYAEVWKDREKLGDHSVGELSETLSPNNYPPRIRGTLRDALSYLFVQQLANTAFWRPAHSNDKFLLDFPALLEGGPKALQLEDPSVHPLLKIGAILTDLEAWHAGRQEHEAALEARLERIRQLQAHFPERREALIRHLEARLPVYRDREWWSMGMSALAELLRGQSDAWCLVRARKLALEGEKAFPESLGALRCRSIAKSIEAPDFQITSMNVDGPGKRSLQVKHKNLQALYFRAYPMDLLQRIDGAKDYDLLAGYRDLTAILKNQQPSVHWKLDLPATPDYQLHTSYAIPPLSQPGLYVIAVSAREDFQNQSNRILATNYLLSDLVLLSRPHEGGQEVTALSGATGRPIAGAKFWLYQYDWQKGHRRLREQSTDEQGLVRFLHDDKQPVNNGFLVAKHGRHMAVDPQFLYFRPESQPSETHAALVYTDRSIYRPLQKVLWKVVAYRGGLKIGNYQVHPDTDLSVSLMDANHQVVESKTVKTNAFGSASGEFFIPAGRMLGSWRLNCSIPGQANIQVEEYKRPTFEVSLKEPESALRLNHEAKLRGEARYYFGLPLSSGSVRWRVTREPVFPHWWAWYGWWGGGPQVAQQVVASGLTALKEDGSYDFIFKPQADETDSKDLSYRYAVSVDVTDEGGETRSATRSFRIGTVAVEAKIHLATSFLHTGKNTSWSIQRQDLDGTPRAGQASWRLTTLAMPERASLPADLPIPQRPVTGEAPFRTEGDLQRPRWEALDPLEAQLRAWPDGQEIHRGNLKHDDQGNGKFDLPSLAAGAYRLHYESADDFGAVYRTTRDFLVVGQGHQKMPLPALLQVESSSVPVGGTARILVHSGLEDQPMVLEFHRNGKLIERRFWKQDSSLLEIPIQEKDRGGFGITLSLVRDHQHIRLSQSILVPWDNKQVKLAFSTFRDRLRPGSPEKFSLTVQGASGQAEAGSAELLAYMYDRSLDSFAPHRSPTILSLYPFLANVSWTRSNLGSRSAQWIADGGLASVPGYPSLHGDQLHYVSGYAIGGMGSRRRYAAKSAATVEVAMEAAAPPPPPAALPAPAPEGSISKDEAAVVAPVLAATQKPAEPQPAQTQAPVEIRSNFSETAFWQPHLLTNADGSVTVEFTVPDSVTSWKVWAHALTQDLRGGSIQKETKSVKELMIRPYLPRFLREGDQAELKVVINNASEAPMKGQATLEIFDPETDRNLCSDFGLSQSDLSKAFQIQPSGSATLSFPLKTPSRVGTVAFKLVARAGDLSDGELRPLPILPGRVHLAQSRFAALKGRDSRTLKFPDMTKTDDPSRIDEQLVVTLDAQLFYSVLQALPYLVDYPYECTEQTLNRFLSTGIVSSVFKQYPAVAKMAQEFSKRETQLERWDEADPNRKMALEETPWLREAQGGRDSGHPLVKILDPRIAKAQRDGALAKLRKAQTSLGAFPWWAGGPPSPWMTLYIVNGFSRALEFQVEVPKDTIVKAWSYLHRHYIDELVRDMRRHNCCWEFVTFLNYALSSYPDSSWTGGVFSEAERRDMLNFSFKHWKAHSPLLKGYLALTLQRSNRKNEAKLVFDSIMDSAKTDPDLGTYWSAEDRSWLWYRDTIESHAFALRALTELSPKDSRRDGLVHWLLLNKKLNHWKSTRATAEVIYSLVHYLKQEGALGVQEDATVTVGGRRTEFLFEPEKYTGKKNQIIVPGGQLDPKRDAHVLVEKTKPGFLFASATWHFSTEKLPDAASGDFFQVHRRYFKRENKGGEWVLTPLAEGATLEVGDQIEVQLSLRSKHESEYVHLRDPRPAGCEPESQVSRYKWDLGIGWYEEIRDSGTNFFFERLPVGEYNFKYRLRASMAGCFRIGPATIQPMYAPEFNAYSAGTKMVIAEK